VLHENSPATKVILVFVGSDPMREFRANQFTAANVAAANQASQAIARPSQR
jgi:hypothetical protein